MVFWLPRLIATTAIITANWQTTTNDTCSPVVVVVVVVVKKLLLSMKPAFNLKAHLLIYARDKRGIKAASVEGVGRLRMH